MRGDEHIVMEYGTNWIQLLIKLLYPHFWLPCYSTQCIIRSDVWSNLAVAMHVFAVKHLQSNDAIAIRYHGDLGQRILTTLAYLSRIEYEACDLTANESNNIFKIVMCCHNSHKVATDGGNSSGNGSSGAGGDGSDVGDGDGDGGGGGSGGGGGGRGGGGGDGGGGIV
uniref:Uncharacterized protein n=1 Tax=Glossina austeni TaxID=7395 RepID=A0A1A9VUI8_GLOAU